MSKTIENGRLGNQVFRNIAVSMIAEKHNLHVDYCNFDKINNKLGIKLVSGSEKYENTQLLTDYNYLALLHSSSLSANVNPNENFFQTVEISQLIFNYIKQNQESIMDKNSFRERYGTNNDLFVHVRLTDAAQWNPGVDYYLTAIKRIIFDKVYFSTDEKDHPIIKRIIQEYPNSVLIEVDEINTIHFASTCKHIILSHGSFSATIGYLAFFSSIFFPKYEEGKIWYGNMFSIDGWTMI